MNKILSFLIVLMLVSTSANASEIPAIVRYAGDHVGRGEVLGDNSGEWVHKYTNGMSVAWCAGFVSYVLKQSGKKVRYTLRAKDFLELGTIVESPRSGDIVVFSRGKWAGHVAIVETVTSDSLGIIEGNYGSFPAKVKRSWFSRTGKRSKSIIGFVRI